MAWLKVDLRGVHVPTPHDCGNAHARRVALRRRLLCDTLSGAEALALVHELRVLELREAADSLQTLQ
jgi:hypothetical protein